MKFATPTLLLASVMSIMACASQPTVSTTRSDTRVHFADLEAEYAGFQTQALTQNYLERKVRHWLNINNGTAMVREIEFARYKHPELLTQIMGIDEVLCQNSLDFAEVQSYRAIHPAFSEYLQSFACVHSGEFNISEDDPAERQTGPAVAMNHDGQFLVIWSGGLKNVSSQRIEAQRFLASGVPLGQRFVVNTGQTDSGYVSNGDTAFFDDGSFIVVWSHAAAGGTLNVYAQRYFADGTLNGSRFKVNIYDPAVSTTTNHQTQPSVATATNGNFAISWTGCNYNCAQREVYARLYSENGATPNPVVQVNTSTTGIQYEPDIAMASDGRFTITWTTNPGYSYDPNFSKNWHDVAAQLFLSDGTKSGGEFRVNTNDTDMQYAPTVALSGDGRFMIAWSSYEQDGDKGGIFAQRFNANGSPLNGELPINALTLHDQSHPSIVLSEDQRFVVTWQSDLHDGSGLGIYTRAFDAQNQPTTAQEIRVNTNTSNHQDSPAMASKGSAMVMVWQSQHSNGGDYSIFGQRFDWLSNGLVSQ